jgi:hypothetical protein
VIEDFQFQESLMIYFNALLFMESALIVSSNKVESKISFP